ncbi:bts1p [Saccharomyces arboricola H-6]|uniref:(2E,6E)-farnesyl diphosphate synthase n=1 Tax=Saccharomyces arboricola (strain H-6 / AS 2.3317 / CBS 10644) TaxID=1160507 RepID=J8PY51_SACAR|nr:bts1p [Saccharomyces arboricola H-6]
MEIQIDELINNDPVWSGQNERLVSKPYSHILLKPGKNFRLNLILQINRILNLPKDQLAIVSQIIELLHNSSLLIDDIEDNAPLRRGQTTSHLIFGIPSTINTANYMYFKAMQLVSRLTTDQALYHELIIIFNEELINLHRGQGLDIYWRDFLPEIIPTQEMYLNMVMNKTGGLFRLTLRLMETLSPSSHHGHSLVPFINLLGIIYQIRDDYLNLKDFQMCNEKGFAEDITEGKLSFPIVHALNFTKAEHQTEQHEEILRILLLRTNDIDLKSKLIEILEFRTDSLNYTKNFINKLVNMIKKDNENKYLPDLTTHPSTNTTPNLHEELLYIIDHLSEL